MVPFKCILFYFHKYDLFTLETEVFLLLLFFAVQKNGTNSGPPTCKVDCP